MKQYFLMKAQALNPKKLMKGKTLWSIKYDGMRAFWDGGVTRGREDVPWCRGIRATGLWSINAKVIHAPDFWTDRLPQGIPCDGELWAGVGGFQQVMSICRSNAAGLRWEGIEFKVFEPVKMGDIFYPRRIDTPTCKMVIDNEIITYMRSFGLPWNEIQPVETIDRGVFYDLESLPFDELISAGHEGVMFRNPEPWSSTQSWGIMKLKPFKDAEGLVTGYTGGKDNLAGMIGSLTVIWQGRTLHISSGLNFAQRTLNGSCKPGEPVAPEVESPEIPRGTVITFKYRELTGKGVPKEARYWRKRV